MGGRLGGVLVRRLGAFQVGMSERGLLGVGRWVLRIGAEHSPHGREKARTFQRRPVGKMSGKGKLARKSEFD